MYKNDKRNSSLSFTTSSILKASDFTFFVSLSILLWGRCRRDLSTIPLATLQRVRPKLPFHTPICLCPGKFIGDPSTFFVFVACRRPPLIVIAVTLLPFRPNVHGAYHKNHYGKRENPYTRLRERKTRIIRTIHRDPLHFFSFLFSFSSYGDTKIFLL